MDVSEDVTATLRAQDHGHPPVICFEPGIAKREGNSSRFVKDVCCTLRAEMGDNQPAVVYEAAMGKVFAIEGNVVDRVSAKNGKGWCEDVAPTLNTQDRHAVCYSVDCRNLYMNEEISGTLQAKNEGGHSLNFINPVCYAIENHPCDSRVTMDDSGIVQTLNARMGTGGGNVPLVLMPVCVIASTSKNAEMTDGEISPTLMTRAGTGGNQLPIAVLKRIEE